MRILVLGGYGLIGLGLVRRLINDGHDVTGLGRNPGLGKRLAPDANWISADLSRLTHPADWQDIIVGFDAIVNASGALQTGGRDNVEAVQNLAIKALIRACETAGIARFVQISAPMADAQAKTDFMASKGQADAALTASGLSWTILRPGLVFAPTAYGGSALIRMLAGLPRIALLTMSDRPVQTIHADEVAEAVSMALLDNNKIGTDADLVEDQPHSLQDVVEAVRRWLGFPDFRRVYRLPELMLLPVVFLADVAGWLGWRSPLRRNAIAILAKGVTGDASETRAFLGRSAQSLSQLLAAHPATLQDRWHARLSLLYPLIVVGLSLFWLASAAIGIWQFEAATGYLRALPAPYPEGLVAAGIFLDLVVGTGLLVRSWTRRAVFSGIAVTLGYLASAAVLTPELWTDPIGPMVKSATLILLHLVLLPLLEER